ncbi:unnamed protein product, partial [Adineta steineri]
RIDPLLLSSLSFIKPIDVTEDSIMNRTLNVDYSHIAIPEL